MPAEDSFLEDFKRVILDTASRCRNCNYCFTVCPVFKSARGFESQTPSGMLQSINYALRWNMFEREQGETLRNLLYLCTTCNSCTLLCKSKSTGVPVSDAIQAGRKILRERMIGPLPQQRKPIKNILLYGNPYGEKPENRLDWSRGLEVKHLPQEKAAILLYIGCTTAYEPNLRKLGRNLVKLLQMINADFGVLDGEVCCGEPARRMGDEGLFQELMGRNTDQFKSTGVKTILTVSPHCFHTFNNEYETMKGEFEIQHYTQFLTKMLKKRKLSFKKKYSQVVTYHDPCYLGKHNQVYDSPRELLEMIPGIKMVEMRMTKADSLCCGGGGGRMFAEVEEEEKLSEIRVRQAVEVGADVISTACPWCHTMLQNGVEQLQLTDRVKVMDIAELFCEGDPSISGI